MGFIIYSVGVHYVVLVFSFGVLCVVLVFSVGFCVLGILSKLILVISILELSQCLCVVWRLVYGCIFIVVVGYAV